MTFHIITLFPESLDSYINSSIVGRAINDKKIKVKFYNPREFFTPRSDSEVGTKNRRIDRKPYGGGPGMVLEAPSVIKAIEKALTSSGLSSRLPLAKGKQKTRKNVKIIWLSPAGKQFDNEYAEKIVKGGKVTDIIFICGRYEGVDERVFKVFKNLKFKIEKITVGPFVVTGGELPAMIILDTISRRIPGVLGKIESVEENRISSSDVYTRPEVFLYPFGKLRAGKGKNYRVPKILLSGHHAKIEEWKQKKR